MNRAPFPPEPWFFSSNNSVYENTPSWARVWFTTRPLVVKFAANVLNKCLKINYNTCIERLYYSALQLSYSIFNDLFAITVTHHKYTPSTREDEQANTEKLLVAAQILLTREPAVQTNIIIVIITLGLPIRARGAGSFEFVQLPSHHWWSPNTDFWNNKYFLESITRFVSTRR